MKQATLRTAVIALLAFGAGITVAHLPQGARAAAAPLQPATIDLAAVTTADLPTPPPGSRNAASKILFAADGSTGQVQIGTGAKHYHADANEVQYVVSGGGTEWLGDKQIALKPGMLIIIPAGTHHAGYTDPNLKLYAIKTPPQVPTDTHYVP